MEQVINSKLSFLPCAAAAWLGVACLSAVLQFAFFWGFFGGCFGCFFLLAAARVVFACFYRYAGGGGAGGFLLVFLRYAGGGGAGGF